ncbi:hypothetical protein DPMN_167863 [Dreissena polymorpha]|uniref:Uncharacterized protein n=1 Tax=Dreissena polymorpha TaxID=45954 RepID=A0A9D4F5C3_DREPO|nr:hypothetical protein DPMN_167863 [Dreissena polymorpha]
MTCQTEGKVHKSLLKRSPRELVVEALDMWDKSEVVRRHLATHRKALDESPFNNQVTKAFCKVIIVCGTLIFMPPVGWHIAVELSVSMSVSISVCPSVKKKTLTLAITFAILKIATLYLACM